MSSKYATEPRRRANFATSVAVFAFIDAKLGEISGDTLFHELVEGQAKEIEACHVTGVQIAGDKAGQVLIKLNLAAPGQVPGVVRCVALRAIGPGTTG